MKKRKPPIVLATILVIMVGIIAILNGRAAPGSEDQVPEPSTVLAKGRETKETTTSLTEMTKRAVGGGDQAAGKRIPGEDNPEDSTPSVLPPKKYKYEPKPGESATATQFYRAESGNK